ncbi:MAG: carboxypeptidase regulatory-like domain-containing protein [Patescibacteria group bacterium]|nr:carboxypeptidase regulatory-like domain-containing protein [Patescibacteria group bacterium]MDE1965909.1 carboxypeptidase regulatory-like domain-containing protein [Patescibacteria group bacterium]
MHGLSRRGMSLIDVIVGTALILIVFLALMGVLRASLLVSSRAKARIGATTLAATQMEYLRGLSYDALGTVGGIPAGSVPQTATTTENGIDYVTHTFIEYIDDPADGTGANDTNGITTDYKRARVSVTYGSGAQSGSVTYVSNFSPPGLETTNGGGTLAVDVVDASGNPVAGATVTIQDPSLSPAVDLTTLTDNAGTVVLPGAATSSDYRVTVTKSGYSTAMTYARDANNQNPNPGYLTVAKNQTTTGTFAIDRLATFSLATFSPIATSTFADSFADTSKLAAMSSTTVSDGALSLVALASDGSARSVATTSPYLARWGEFSATTTVPSGATLLFHIYDGSGNLLPDTALPGNSAGFSAVPVLLYGISTTTYPSLAADADFSMTGSTSPSVTHWSLSYTAGPVPLPHVSYTLTGAKTVGSTGAGAPIYKTVMTASTGSAGTDTETLEWDSYTLSLSGYDIEDACPSSPYAVAPAATFAAKLILGAATANSLRVLVSDNAGSAVGGASVTLADAGYSKTVSSSSCGDAYFGGVPAATDYTVTIAKTGYTTTQFTNVAVSGETVYNAAFP